MGKAIEGVGAKMKGISVGLWLMLCAALAGCGTVATPIWEGPTETARGPRAESTATATRMPSATPLPPTVTMTPEPTATDTPQPSASPMPTATEVLSPIDRMVSMRDAENGAALFAIVQEAADNYSCANCHSVTSEEILVGPGLLNIKSRGAGRVEGQSAAEYIFNSIVDPKALVVGEFDAELMPGNWADIYTNLEIFDIVAYLLTLEG